jgi:hypothetical protein
MARARSIASLQLREGCLRKDQQKSECRPKSGQSLLKAGVILSNHKHTFYMEGLYFAMADMVVITSQRL